MSDSPYISVVTSENFDEAVLKKSFESPVLVDFWAGWCNPCKILMPMLARLAEEYDGKFFLAKVDTDVERELAVQFGVRSLPTVKVFKQGEVVDEFMGAIPEAQIKDIIENNLTRPSDPILAEAKQHLANGDIAQAKTLMQQALELDPERQAIIIGMAEVLLQEGDCDSAKTIMEKIPFAHQNDEDVEMIKSKLMFAEAIDAHDSLEALTKFHEAEPKNTEALHKLGAMYAISGDYEKALEHFLQLLVVDKSYKEGLPRKSMLAIFSMLGSSGPLVNLYRSKMSSALM